MKYFKKLLIVLMLLMVLAGCSQKSSSDEVIPDENKVEGRTAIIFKQIDNKTVTVKRDGEDLESYEGMRLNAGDSVSTDENSTVYIRVDDDKNILLDKQTTMVVSELRNGKLVMYLETGSFFFDLENKLENGEEVSFDLGGTTMSIRGTSGQGSKKQGKESFAIFTGLGAVTAENGLEAQLKPNTKVEFEIDDNNNPVSYSFNTVKNEDVLDVTKNYVKENNEYQGKVENSKWAQEITGKTTEDADDGSENLNSKPGTYGWIQQADGSWIFSKETYDQKSESVPYEKPKPASTSSNSPKPAAQPEPEYDPEPEQQPTPQPTQNPEPQTTPGGDSGDTTDPDQGSSSQNDPGDSGSQGSGESPEGGSQSVDPMICPHCNKKIELGEEGLHTIMGSALSIAYRAMKFGAGSDLTTMELCQTHYLCELETISSYDLLYAHSSYIGDDNVKHYRCE